MANATSTQLQELYVAYFGRAADPTGLDYWTAKGTSTAAFAANMYAQPEFKSEYGSLSIESQVNQIYQNLFSRAADVTGIRYWTQEIKLGNLQLAEIAVHLIWAAQNNAGSADDKTALTNRTNAAVAYTDKVKETTAGILAYQPTSTDPWVAGSNITTAKSFLSTIDKDTTHTATTVAASVTTITSAGTEADASVAKSFTLTTNTDAGPSFTGGVGADTFSSSSSTFNSDDVLDGGAGSDIFSVTASGDGAVVANFTSIETVRALNGGASSTDYGLNMIGATGATELVSRLSTGEVSFDNVQADAKITAFGTQTSSKTTVGFLNALASGTADTVNLKVDGGADTTFNVSGTDTANQFETINIESAGSTKNTVAGLKDYAGSTDVAAVTALNITGTADLDITLLGGGTSAAASASAATGDVKMVWGGNYTSLTGGSGADTFDATGASFLSSSDAPKTIAGGSGTDKVMFAEDVSSLTSSTSTTDHSVSGVETLEVEAKLANGGTADLNRTVEADLIAGITTIQIDAANNDTSGGGGDSADDVLVTVNDIVDEVVEIQSLDGTVSATVNLSSVVLNLKTDTGDSDSISIKTLNPSSTSTTILDALTVDSSDSGTTANTLPEIVNLEIGSTDVSTVDGTAIASLSLAYSETLNITGAGDATITAVELRDPSGTSTATINAGTYTGNLTLGSSSAGFKNTAADTISLTLGSGTNTVDYVAEALSADVITATAGTADTVKLTEAATDVEMTIDGVEDLEIRGAGASKVISAKNFTNVETIELYDTADAGGDDIKLTNVAATQAIEIHSTNATSEDWNGGTVTLDSAAATATSTGATSLSVSIKGDTALNVGDTTATISVDTSGLTIADGNVNTSDGFSFDQRVAIVGTTITGQTVDLNSLTLTGGGLSAASTNAVLTVTGTSNVDIDTLDATGLASDLVITGLDTGSAAAITMGDTSNKITIALADAARDAVDIDGGGGTDTVVFTEMATGTYRPGLTNVEKLDVDTGDNTVQTAAITLHLGDAASVTTVELDLDGGDEDVTVAGASNVTSYLLGGAAAATSDVVTLGSSSTLTITNEAALGATDLNLVTPDATTLTIKQGHGSATDFHTITAAKATTMNLGGTDADTAGTQYAGGLEATTVDAGELVTLNIDSNQGARTINTLTAAKLTTLNIVGDNAVSVGATGATTTLLGTIDASTSSGGVTIAGNVDLTSTANVTLGTAADTLTLDILTESNVVVNAGEHATTDTGVNDTLALAGANNQGLTVVDLSSTTDQVTQINGAVNTAAITNFENITLSGLTGSQTASVTGSDEANVIIGTANADTILGGKGADTITMGDGTDTVLGEAGDDIFVVLDEDDIVAGGNVEDTITGGDDTADTLHFDTTSGAQTYANTVDFGTVTGVEKITKTAHANVLSISTKADFYTDTGIVTFDLSGDTTTTGTNVIDLSATTWGSATAVAITGSTGPDTITLGEGVDTVIGGASTGVDTIIVTDREDLGTTSAVTDSITTGGGSDILQINGGVTIPATMDFTTKLSGVTEVTTNASTSALSISLHADWMTDTSIVTFDLSGDTNSTAGALLDLSAPTFSASQAVSVTGGSGSDTLNIVQNAVLGGFQVDLSASGDHFK